MRYASKSHKLAKNKVHIIFIQTKVLKILTMLIELLNYIITVLVKYLEVLGSIWKIGRYPIKVSEVLIGYTFKP